MKLFDDIQAAGNTVVLVTHEEDIAQYAERVIRLVDGNIDSDTTNYPVLPKLRSRFKMPF